MKKTTMNNQEIINKLHKLQNNKLQLNKWISESEYLLGRSDRLQAEQIREEIERLQRDLELINERLSDVKSQLKITRLQIACRPEGNYLIATGKTIKS